MKATLVFFAAAVWFGSIVGCSAKPGGSCNESNDGAQCSGDKAQLVCVGGTWKQESCLGPKGCTGEPRHAQCDTSLAEEKSSCSTERAYSCTPDRKTELKCKAGTWTATAQCPGEKGCDATGFFVQCPGALVTEGGECDPPKDSTKKNYGCSLDKKAALLCKDGKWTRIQECYGPKGCDSGFMSISCDGAVASAGQLCDPADKPDYACSPDKKALMICQGEAKWRLERACLGPKGCSTTVLGVDCDTSVVEPNSTCAKDGAAACSTDGKTILECKGGKFVSYKKCSKACDSSSMFIQCAD